MTLIQRIGYYLGGFSIGLVILAFFLNGKKTSCSYGPDARVLKNINTKTINYSENISQLFNNKIIDASDIKYILKKGDINFSKSNPRLEPCAVYVVEGKYNDEKKEATLIVENCDSIATILNLKLHK
ncbi:MAG: hypothetical protein P8K68_11470 [Algibacter sp.]|uniref:hypothetical protein n=1 Tax=Algibacter sp. TaxID=1872428 RepID=UPI00262F7F7B|nr:hypothetical protein [Algibacter sp.]MDG1730884.1 hypothetical protein [Algibacter sp.]MDG2179386.1 hypothetical protein [Algibacter sp.]